MNWRKNILLKKARRYGMTIPRFYNVVTSDSADYIKTPPIFLNSFPKSGTHLLMQVLQAIPGIKDWGLFLASTPSYTFKEIPATIMAGKIKAISPGELVTSHVYSSSEVDDALDIINAVKYFIYRDPRDVVISEAYYLATMNRWHKLHDIYSSMSSDLERFQLSISGLPEGEGIQYQDIGARFMKYSGWVSSKDCLPIKFEHLRSDSEKVEVVRNILSHYIDRVDGPFDLSELTDVALKNIDPGNSHTFRSGGMRQWQDLLTDQQIDNLKVLVGDLLIDLGYEKNLNWD